MTPCRWVCTALTFLLLACSPSHRRASEAQIDLLASDAHVVIGGEPLILPFIALTSYVAEKPFFSLDRAAARKQARQRLDMFHAAARSASTAPKLKMLEISVHAYGWNDADTSFRRICPRLRREWAKSLCDDPWAPLRQAMPYNAFHLVDFRRLEAFDAHWTVGNKRKGDQLRAMRFRQGRVSIVCDKAMHATKRFCTAALPIQGHLGAVWAVWDEGAEGESHEQQAQREAAAILAFTNHAIGSREDFPKLLAAACASRRPGSRLGPFDVDPCHSASAARNGNEATQ